MVEILGGGQTCSCLARTSNFGKGDLEILQNNSFGIRRSKFKLMFKEGMCAVCTQFVSVSVRLHLVTVLSVSVRLHLVTVYHFFDPVSTVRGLSIKFAYSSQ